jgi:hypothetical protein
MSSSSTSSSARARTITADDVNALNAQVLESLPHYKGLDSVCVTRTSKGRHHINQLQRRRFAEDLMQDIYVFPAAHTRTKKKHRGLRVDDLLAMQDGDGDAKGPGLFLYTKGMPSQSSSTSTRLWD